MLLSPSPYHSVTNKYLVIPERISCHVGLRHNRSCSLPVTQIDVRYCPSFHRRPSSLPLIRFVQHSSFVVTVASTHFLRRWSCSNSSLMLLRLSFPLNDNDPCRVSFRFRLCWRFVPCDMAVEHVLCFLSSLCRHGDKWLRACHISIKFLIDILILCDKLHIFMP